MEPDDYEVPPIYSSGATEPEVGDAYADGSAPDLPPPQPYHPEWYKLHPGFLESLVPIWGPAREAAVDSADGDNRGWAFNTGLAIADAAGAGALLRGGIKFGSHTWPATRRWLTKTGFADKGQVVHHAGLERNRGIGKYLPDWFKNQPFNLKPMPSAQIHDRMNHAAWGMPRLNFLERYHYGTPDWLKWAKSSAIGHGLLGDWRAHQDANNGQDQK
jgi:hypothetical protein